MATGYPISLSSAPGTLLLNQQIDNVRFGTPDQQPDDQPQHPHLIDKYEPPGPISIVLWCRHGGAFNKIGMANYMGVCAGLPTTRTTLWGRLASAKMAVWIPQGGHCTPANAGPWNPNGVQTEHPPDHPNGISGWSNRCYWSGYDDPALDVSASAAMQTRYGSAIRVAFGHSEGGIMTARDWYDHKFGGFNVHASVSGPTPTYYRDNPTLPGIPTPYRAQVSLNDENIGIKGGHLSDATWQGGLNPTLSQAVNPIQFIGELQQLQTRVNAYNTFHSLPPETVNLADGVVVDVAIGTKTTLSYSGGKNQLVIYSQPDHSLVNQQKAAGVALITDIALWVRSLLL